MLNWQHSEIVGIECKKKKKKNFFNGEMLPRFTVGVSLSNLVPCETSEVPLRQDLAKIYRPPLPNGISPESFSKPLLGFTTDSPTESESLRLWNLYF